MCRSVESAPKRLGESAVTLLRMLCSASSNNRSPCEMRRFTVLQRRNWWCIKFFRKHSEALSEPKHYYECSVEFGAIIGLQSAKEMHGLHTCVNTSKLLKILSKRFHVKYTFIRINEIINVFYAHEEKCINLKTYLFAAYLLFELLR